MLKLQIIQGPIPPAGQFSLPENLDGFQDRVNAWLANHQGIQIEQVSQTVTLTSSGPLITYSILYRE